MLIPCFFIMLFIIYLCASFLPIILPFVAIYIVYKIVCFLKPELKNNVPNDGENIYKTFVKYCNANHGTTDGKLCAKCTAIFSNIMIKISLCPYGINKPICEQCETPCFDELYLPPTPKFTSKDIRDMNPRDFEVFIANIFSDNGYSTKVTQYTSDGGKDIIIKKNGITYYVECKHWESAVGRPELQKLVGAAVGNAVSDLIFISTGGFNVNARNYAKDVNAKGNLHLDLWTMEDILKIANKKMRIEHIK